MSGGWVPPNEAARTKAVAHSAEAGRGGSAAGCPRWLCDCALNRQFFVPKTPLRSGDWLSGPGRGERAGQSFEQFQRQHHPRRRATEERNTIHLVPVGDITGVDVPALAAFVEAWFGLPVVLMGAVAVSQLKQPKPRQNEFGEQLLTKSILEHLARHCKPPAAYCSVAFTMTDLYPDPRWNFVFGEADPSARVGCFSFARYERAPGKGLLWRSCATLVHEIGHLFDVAHCVYYQCAMNGANDLRESDESPLCLCPVDERKLLAALAGVPSAVRSGRERHERLLAFFDGAGAEFAAEAAWTRARIAACDAVAGPQERSWVECSVCDDAQNEMAWTATGTSEGEAERGIGQSATMGMLPPSESEEDKKDEDDDSDSDEGDRMAERRRRW